MEKQTVRITLRMSESLYNLLMESAGEISRPLNSEIVKRLESTFLGSPKSGVSEKINDLGGNHGLSAAQREEVERMIREALGK